MRIFLIAIVLRSAGSAHSADLLVLTGLVSPAAAQSTGVEFQDCATCPKMVVVPAGSFMMGSPKGEQGRNKNEGPQHRVTIPKSFAVGKFEVTVAQFSTFIRETDHNLGSECSVGSGEEFENRSGKNFRDPGFSQTGLHPATCLSWDDAKAYVAWLSRKTGKPYRLLSEAEWEYAARSGTTTRFHFGDNESDLCSYVNGADRSTSFGWKNNSCSDGVGEKTAEVGRYNANAFGLHDMHGNVWESVEDCWNENYAGAPSDGRSRTSGDCSIRVLRGGSWNNDPRRGLRSAVRARHRSDRRGNVIGLRVARTL